MSLFQVTITPERMKPKRVPESREPVEVVMAPFSSKAIVQFEDVPVTKTARRILRIMNPSADEIEVRVTKGVSDEHNLSISWTENVVPAQDEIQMEMVWSPQLAIACKETLQLQDNRNFRKDVMIILKSKSNQPAKSTKRFPTISSGVSNTHAKTLRLKSPKGGASKPQKSISADQKKRVMKLKAGEPKQEERQRWNATPLSSAPATAPASSSQRLRVASAFTTTTTTTTSNTQISPLRERNRDSDVQLMKTPLHGGGNKENVSPLTPVNMLSLIDKLKFTPATDSKSTTVAMALKVENLSSWPTPLPHDSSQAAAYEIRPRRLNTDDLVGTEEATASTSRVPPCPRTPTEEPALVSNKTFEVKREDLLDDSTEGPAATPLMNRTTTVLSTPAHQPLEMIQEEECSFESTESATKLQKTYTKPAILLTSPCDSPPPTDLKRDIKLVGTPLRKYSESMKDLSMKSPQPKVGIQGSMPNLKDIETIRSFENNRYLHQNSMGRSCAGMSTIHEQSATGGMLASLKSRTALNESSESVNNSSHTSTVSQADINFDFEEIRAQSSRFNMHEVGLKSRRSSPVFATKQGQKNKTPSPHEAGHSRVSPSQKRNINDLSLSDGPSTESLREKASSGKVAGCLVVSPPKRLRLESDPKTSANRSKSWAQTQPKKLRVVKPLTLLKKPPASPRKAKSPPPRVKLYDSDLYLQSYINPDPFAATTTCDPFLASTMYLDERAVDRHQQDFKKWLNALVTIPAELDTDCDKKVDVGKLFNEVRNKELTLAPTKEEQSMNYLTKARLESLRRAAVELFLSESMRLPCSKVAVYVNKNALRIRADRNLHLDVVMQRDILELLLCFNPLWLRLGLEVVYGEKIHLHSNGDIVGLSTFILNRLFRDKFLEQKYSKAYTLSAEYAEHIKKFTLQKMLFLLLFLDKAKSDRIVKHNPCLFVKQSPHKETKDILLRFSSELLANVGDITRDLKRLGYVLQHKQSYLDEFDYAFQNVAVDLRDGIRLTRVMEIILLRDDLSRQLRVPAISRLQRVYNVNLAMRALGEADFQLSGDIAAADIVDGHREKTLSLLWQIIYKFRSPKFHAAARLIQQWWRHSWLRIVIRRRIAHKVQQRREAAATCIQAWYRGLVARRWVRRYREDRSRGAVVLQKYTRGWLARRQYAAAVRSIVSLQRRYRAQKVGVAYRRQFLAQRQACVRVQQWWRHRRMACKLLVYATELKLQRDQRHQAAASCIQTVWRSYCEMKVVREEFVSLRRASCVMQRQYRARRAMLLQRAAYQRTRKAVVTVQQRYRAMVAMRCERIAYNSLRNTAVAMQRRRRSLLEMRATREQYCSLRQAVVSVQTRWRAMLSMRQQRATYMRMRLSICVIQQHYRARLAMQHQRAEYVKTHAAIVCLQLKWRATLVARRIRSDYLMMQRSAIAVQQRFRSKRQMHLERGKYEALRKAALVMQRRRRATLAMRRQRNDYQRQRRAALALQQHWRAYKSRRLCQAKYRGIQEAVRCLQQHIRGYLLMKRMRGDFLRHHQAAVTLQRAWRARCSMVQQRQQFEQYRQAVVHVQQRYRALRQMRQVRVQYEAERSCIIRLQVRYRAKLYARRVRLEYHHTVQLIVSVQRRVRATLQMRAIRAEYLEQRRKIVLLQRSYRNKRLMQLTRAEYETKRQAAITIQRWFRSLLRQRCDQLMYRRQRSASVTLQRAWRATLASRAQRQRFLLTVQRIVLVQRVLRATLLMRKERLAFEQYRAAVVVVQRRYRARRHMLQIRSQYLLIRSLIVCIQRKFRAKRAMRVQRADYQLLRSSVIHLQQKFRGRRLTTELREHFVSLRSNIVHFQAAGRGLLARRRYQALLTPEMLDFLRRKKAAKLIQRCWRGYRIRKRFNTVAIQQIRTNIKLLKKSTNAMNTVKYKMQDAIRILRGRYRSSDALRVLMCLDRISRTVPHLLMSNADFISTFCYDIMAQTIRSEVDKHVLRYCSRIVLNMARYTGTAVSSFHEESLATIATILLRWCDKDGEIFNTLCTLIWVFSHCARRQEVIRNYMTTAEALYLVRETKKLVARKEKMKQNVRKPTVQVTAPQANGSFSSRALPSLDPDFGVIHNKPYTFISSVYAFDTILCKLGIDIF